MAQARKQTKRPVSGKKNVRNYSKTQKKFVKNFTGKYKKQSKKKKQQQGVSSLILILLILIAGFVYFRFFNEKERFPIAEGDIAVHFIDVGQGDSIFIESGGETMLIDCGESSETDKVISYLEGMNVEKLDYVIATHPHSDHMGYITLFYRTPKGVSLTENGAIFFEFVKNGVESFLNGEHKLTSLNNLETGHLKIGASTTVTRYFLLPYIEQFHKTYPKIEISITNHLTNNLISLLKNGSLDFLIVNLPMKTDNRLKVISCCELHDCFARKY